MMIVYLMMAFNFGGLLFDYVSVGGSGRYILFSFFPVHILDAVSFCIIGGIITTIYYIKRGR